MVGYGYEVVGCYWVGGGTEVLWGGRVVYGSSLVAGCEVAVSWHA